jgi:hypothetical protein
MSRRPARFTEADATRAAKAARRAGMAVEILPDGIIRIVPVEQKGTEPVRAPKVEPEIDIVL